MTVEPLNTPHDITCVSAAGAQQGAAEALHTHVHLCILFMGWIDLCTAILLRLIVIRLIGGADFF